MIKKIVIGICICLLLSTFGASAFPKNSYNTQEETLILSEPTLVKHDDTLTVELAEATSVLNSPYRYQLPKVTRVYQFPFGTKIYDVSVRLSEKTSLMLEQNPSQASLPIPDIISNQVASNLAIYREDRPTDEIYPESHFHYSVHAGRRDADVTTIVVVNIYPVQYEASTRLLSYAEQADVQISFTPAEKSYLSADEYDMVIITPSRFADELSRLVIHKNSYNVQTKLVTLNDIYTSEYFPVEGRDDAEQVKYFIKNAFDEWGISYVLLVGGRKGGILNEKWWTPVRYSHLDDGGESSYLTDLYFADLYDSEQQFSSWDSNDNGIFAEWKGLTKDTLDMYPEVYVGRLACRNIFEVQTLVDKIITYETTAYDSGWFTTFVGVAGDTYPNEGDPYYEGELATEAAFNLLEGFTPSFLWTSTETFTGPDVVIDEISKGCGFAHFSGHGNPSTWGNHPPHSDDFISGPTCFDMNKMTNKDELPVVLVGGCHNAQYNVSLLNILKGILQDGLQYFSTESPLGKFWYKEWVPRCWAWAMLKTSRGGSIAVIANTGLGYGKAGENCLEERGRFMEVLFFQSYNEGHDNLGETHAYDIMYYMDEYPPMEDLIDCKIAQQWALLGDPSLQIGGYET
jgi:hypothetical protein